MDANGMLVYVYELEPTQEDGRGTSGWTVTVVTKHSDLSDLLSIMQVAIEEEHTFGDGNRWTGIKRATLLTTAVLDPRIAA